MSIFKTCNKIKQYVIAIHDSSAYYKLRQRVITIYHNLAITTFGNCYYNLRRLLLQFTTGVTTHDIIITPANKACVNTNSKIFFRRMTGVLPVKKKKKQFKSHLKNRCPTRPIRQLVCKVGRKRVFSCFDFRSYLKANYPDCFHFLLKVFLPGKFIARKQ